MPINIRFFPLILFLINSLKDSNHEVKADNQREHYLYEIENPDGINMFFQAGIVLGN